MENKGGYVKKIIVIFILASFLAAFTPLFAAETKKPDNAGVSVTQVPRDTVFNRLSDFFSEFDKTYARRGNKQGFWDATADWMRNINKQ